MKIALSPCPNDTVLFHAWIEGHVGREIQPEPHFADIEELNKLAKKGAFPLIKVSVAHLNQIERHYSLLPVGAALTSTGGPKLISLKKLSLSDLPECTMVLPGQKTTAHTLAKALLPKPKRKFFLPYHQIFECLKRGEADCGVIIHESRFTHTALGFHEMADLGALWAKRTRLPLPLGCLVAHKDLGKEVHDQLTTILQASFDYARKYPEASTDFITHHAQEKDPRIIADHIDLYVTDETRALSPEGHQAIAYLRDLS